MAEGANGRRGDGADGGAMSKGMSKGHPPRAKKGEAKKGTPTPDARRQQGWGRGDTHSEGPMGYPLNGRRAMADGTTTPGSPTPANRRDLEQRLQ